MRIFLSILAFVLCSAVPAAAQQESSLKSLLTGNDSRGWEAVGRLNLAGNAFCTGALIAPDLVLTAAHCLFDQNTGRRFRIDEIEFLAGWRNGTANAYAGLRRAIPHPKFNFTDSDKTMRIAYDVALLQLDVPIRKVSITPFETGQRPKKNAIVGVVSYAHDRAEQPSLQESCSVLARRSGTLVLSCDVDFGSSGSPIFSIDEDGKAKIVSVISSKAIIRDEFVALGTSLSGPLQDLKQLMALDPNEPSRPTIRVRKPSTAASTGGAKFVRP